MARMGAYLMEHGGLDDAVRRAYEGTDVAVRRQRKTEQINLTLSRIRSPATE